MKDKYKIIFDRPGFVSLKEEYETGEEVEVCFKMVATDTDYWFQVEVEKYKQDFDYQKGIIIRFTMPDHDVHISVTSRNTMMRDPNIKIPGIDHPADKKDRVLKKGEWICPECGARNSGKYCSECGTKKPDDK